MSDAAASARPNPPPTPHLEPGDKISKVMAYTQDAMIWGDVISKEAIRVSTWLRTQSAPQYLPFFNAQVLMVLGSAARPFQYPELYLPVNAIQAYHLMPPARDPVDYDPDEPNRRMEPVTCLLGSFRFDGCLRMSTATNLARFLDVSKEQFTSLYEVEVTQPANPRIGVIRVPFVLLRRELVIFAPRPNG